MNKAIPDMSMMQPHNIDAEKLLLGCLLQQGESFGVVQEMGLSDEDFYEICHRKIYRALSKLYSSGKTPDIVTVSDELEKIKDDTENPDMESLAEYINNAPISSEKTLREWTGIIIEKSLHRQHIKICHEAAERSSSPDSNFHETIDSTTTKLLNLSTKNARSSVQHIGNLISTEMQSLRERISRKEDIVGISSGYQELDHITNGFKKGEMIVFAGRPAMGKTSFALNVATNIAKEGKTVLFFSLEMPNAQLTRRVLSFECMVDSKKLQTGKMSEKEYSRIWNPIDSLGKIPLFFDDAADLTFGQIRAKAKKIRKEHGSLDIVFLDYLQLMKSDVRSDDRHREVEAISRNIKLFAKELDIPFVALAQLSRKVEDRKKKTPMLSDLRDSGSIEQDADMVMFLYRDVVYDKNSSRPNEADVMVEKNRNGAQGVATFHFTPEYTKFTSLDYRDDA